MITGIILYSVQKAFLEHCKMPDTKVTEQMKCMIKHKIVMKILSIRHFFLLKNE